MPKNYFINREERSKYPSQVKLKDYVFIVAKEDQGTKDFHTLYFGIINNILSGGEGYANGFKVNIEILDKGDFDFEDYYRTCILNFNDLDNVSTNKVLDFYNFAEKTKRTGTYKVGRIQYFGLPKNFKPKTISKELYLGLHDNKLCDLDFLNNQINIIKSKYVIKDPSFYDHIEQMKKYRTLSKIFTKEKLLSMNCPPCYCQVIIESNNFLVKSKLIY